MKTISMKTLTPEEALAQDGEARLRGWGEELTPYEAQLIKDVTAHYPDAQIKLEKTDTGYTVIVSMPTSFKGAVVPGISVSFDGAASDDPELGAAHVLAHARRLISK